MKKKSENFLGDPWRIALKAYERYFEKKVGGEISDGIDEGISDETFRLVTFVNDSMEKLLREPVESLEIFLKESVEKFMKETLEELIKKKSCRYSWSKDL